jgi:serine/threonine-protein kinase RsbW
MNMNVMTGPKVELRIPGEPRYVRVARMAVGAVASEMDFGVDVVADIKDAVAEACNNAIEHAECPEGHPGEITITLFLEQDRLAIIVCDKGAKPATLPAARQPDDLAESGYGLLLMQAFMDEFSWDAGPTGTTVRMAKRLAR